MILHAKHAISLADGAHSEPAGRSGAKAVYLVDEVKQRILANAHPAGGITFDQLGH
jgi:hypothetical protein